MTTATVLEKIKLIYVDVNGNNNKVWQAELRNDGLLVQWGRVGAKLQEKFHAGAGYSKFDSLKREKLAKGYTPAQTMEENSVVLASTSQSKADIKQIAVEQIQTDDVAKRLIEYLTEVNIHNILAGTTLTYQGGGTFTTPLGAVTPVAIAQARQLLAQLASNPPNRADLLNQYLRLVPQNLGSRINASLFSTAKELQQQSDLLDALASVVPTARVTETVFDCSVSVVPYTTEDGRATFRRIRRLFESSANASHVSARFKLKRLYELRMPEMQQQFERQLGNVQQLWHGTKASNLLSILKNGLIILPATAAQCTGRMFGNGVYFSKPIYEITNYATDFWNKSGGPEPAGVHAASRGGVGQRVSTAGVSEQFQKLTHAPAGCDSLWAAPGSCNVINHEAIVYRTSQVDLRYLCEFE